MASDLHAGRQAEADRLFIEQHGELTRAPAPVIEVRHAAVATRRLDPA
ncbi:MULTISPECIES: hypothetical protein [unclassified Paracoccus (in: a-proteobacteria)]|nr:MULTISPECIES: hypothetical protein [unclassified Paracoccus (in: a-proteobacteria)]MBB1492992.1 hypothetical protein [Paracoccus sp. MC1854]MBB1499654.1 hypothetical protein [Paracoccus sp. MC1862]QQO44223.1 hypothetical protein JGR78_12645 [Paracoccus sp. MC1862]